MRLTKVTEGGPKVSSTIAHDPIGRATAIKRPYDVSGKDPSTDSPAPPILPTHGAPGATAPPNPRDPRHATTRPCPSGSERSATRVPRTGRRAMQTPEREPSWLT
jgi:hypothetical protein